MQSYVLRFPPLMSLHNESIQQRNTFHEELMDFIWDCFSSCLLLSLVILRRKTDREERCGKYVCLLVADLQDDPLFSSNKNLTLLKDPICLPRDQTEPPHLQTAHELTSKALWSHFLHQRWTRPSGQFCVLMWFKEHWPKLNKACETDV